MEVVQFFIIFLMVCDLASARNATNEANRNEEGRFQALEDFKLEMKARFEALETGEWPRFPHKPIGLSPSPLNFL